MGRKNRRNHIHTEDRSHEHTHHHHHDATTHHHDHDRYVGELESTGEIVSSGELDEDLNAIPKHISVAGRHLPDYPRVFAHETSAIRERRRQETIAAQQANIDRTPNEEDLRINRYRANHLPIQRAAAPHEQIDDEITVTPEDFNTKKTTEGSVLIDPLAHEKAGAKQGAIARHAAIKRQRGLGDEDKTISPASPVEKK